MKKTLKVHIIGGGLAGVEAAVQLTRRGIPVRLSEMRPRTMTPAHRTGQLAEVVCSNSFKGTDPTTAHGLLKQEMRQMGSLVLEVADHTCVPAGKALAVDREAFAREITARIEADPLIELVREEVTAIDPATPTIVASGPLTSEALCTHIQQLTGRDDLHFYDAIAPIVDAASIDMDHAFYGSRWDPESDDYLNCPMDKETYDAFVEALVSADRVTPHAFEDERYFEGCLPVEVIAGRGADTLRYGPMRPIGFTDPSTDRRPWAVLQLRRENLKGDAYNLVGFQTRLSYPEQKRVFGLIPGLHAATFLHYGSIHRNTFINAPGLLARDLSMRDHPHVFFAGQLTGVEGYMESAMSGIMAGLGMACRLAGRNLVPPGPETAIGALLSYLDDTETKDFQPMNINFGIMAMPDVHKKQRREERVRREAEAFSAWWEEFKNQGSDD